MTKADRQTATPEVALILAAGLGSRLSQNPNVPKPLTKVLGLSLGERVVCTLHEAMKIRRFVLPLATRPTPFGRILPRSLGIAA